ncbi:hypothetical protein BJ508DRAFT_305890 [Ascobolus immersus RN42]|uniref:Uncharacterized protein n=1 Tax=Ascobolus immersus RN42 TaxID=1160509 RepID=A0A3N4I817_ASCIM|nr:hypothetical protein BJ508DRAFT_305890 [Ascobolus immersus RN42]
MPLQTPTIHRTLRALPSASRAFHTTPSTLFLNKLVNKKKAAAAAAAKAAAKAKEPELPASITKTTAAHKNIPAPGSFDDVFRDKTAKEDRNAPPPTLIRPLGFPNPPRAGENSGIDTRSLKERRDDFHDYEKHLKKRQQLEKRLFTPYFRDYMRMSASFRGKSFFSPTRLFKRDSALFFPNLVGQSLLGTYHDLAPLLSNKISIICVFSSRWAESQVQAFARDIDSVSEFETAREFGADLGEVQRVDVNIEENVLKRWVIKMSVPGIKRVVPEHRWGRYLVVSQGVSDEVRENTGLWNSKVGYTFLVDGEARIRWAGSGEPVGEEKEALLGGIRRLVAERRAMREGKVIDG